MKSGRTRVIAAAGLLCLTILPAHAQASPTTPLGPTKGVYGGLFDVSVTSAASGWAVGDNPESRGPILKHWNGVSWHFTAVPHPPDGDMDLYGVDSTTPDDVWAVGDLFWDSGSREAVILHWGGKTWHRSPAPAGSMTLIRVDARSPRDVWAVGYDYDKDSPAVLHWDGDTWVSVPLPASLGEGPIELHDVVAVARDDAWVVGTDFDTYGPAVIGHWNGTSWTRVHSPRGTGRKTDLVLFGLSATSSDDVWASGVAGDPDGLQADGLIEHWDGKAWTIVPSAQPSRFSRLDAITAISRDDIWAVGFKDDPGHEAAFPEHWDGTSWAAIETPPLSGDSQLLGVSASNADSVWAVGIAADFRAYRQVILYWNGRAWSRQHS